VISVRRRPRSRGGALSTWLALVLVACERGPTAPAGLTVTATGKWIERGATVQLQATLGGTPIPPTAVIWTVTPPGAVSISAGGAAHLLDSGTIVIHASASAITGTLVLHILAPPTILFDLHDTLTDTARAGNRDIYRVALDGGDLVRLTSGAGDNIEPAPSPTTPLIVFVTYRTGSPTLYTVPFGGTMESRLSGLPYPASDPAVSTDGTQLAFIAPSGGSAGLWTSILTGASATAVAGTLAGSIIASPTWCKGGDSVVVVTTAFGDASLYVESATTGTGRPLTNGTTYDVNPACASDDSSIVFASTRDGDLGIFVLAGPAGSETVRRLDPMPASDGQPSWLYDGRVVFVSAVGTDSAQLAWLDPSASDSVTLIPIAGHGGPEYPRALPNWP
jgi:Tol biopolymer transport system component